MNNNQLEKVSKYLNVKAGNNDDYADDYGDIVETNPGASIIS